MDEGQASLTGMAPAQIPRVLDIFLVRAENPPSLPGAAILA